MNSFFREPGFLRDQVSTKPGQDQNDALVSPVIPRQMAGSATGLPSLLPATKVPAADEPAGGWRAEVQPPSGAVPAEDRSQDTATASAKDSGLPAGVRRAEVGIKRREALKASLRSDGAAMGYLTCVKTKLCG